MTLENHFPTVNVDIEMNSLEDAYVNIAKAEEKLHNEQNNIVSDLEKPLNDAADFQRYLGAGANPIIAYLSILIL